MSNYDTIATQLRERLPRLLRRVRAIDEDLRSPHDRDSQDRASELENDEVLEGLDEMSLAEVGQIRAALERIEVGLYGLCATCGRPIAAARLAAVPTAITCVRCTPQG